MDDLEQRTIRKVAARLIPFLIVCYFVAYLDRVNVGFAALTMNKDLGLTATMFGFGSGIFFLAYFLFEVPSNLLLDRFGASRWIARIMVTWGVISGLMAFIPQISQATGLSSERTFYLLRVLLGAAEAGFFPGVIFYLTLWFPSVYRARIVGYFMAAIPVSSAIGSPVSGLLLGLHGLGGLAGWQWLFLIEAAPALLLAVATYFYLTDRPTQANWLAADERNWLEARLLAERAQREGKRQLVWAATRPGLAPVYFCAATVLIVAGFWPILAALLDADDGPGETTWLILGAVAAMAMLLTRQRTTHAVVAVALSVAGIYASVRVPAVAMLALPAVACVAFVRLRVFALALVYFGAVAGLYGVGFWLPQIVKAFGLSNARTGWVVAIPYVVAAIGMVWFGRWSDRSRHRQYHVAAALAVAAAGIAASTLTRDPVLTMLAFTVGSCGVFAVLPVFWTLPTALLSGTSAAAGIAVINAVGNLAGFAGPTAMGWIKDLTGSFSGGLLTIAGLAILAMATVLALGHDRELERVPGR